MPVLSADSLFPLPFRGPLLFISKHSLWPLISPSFPISLILRLYLYLIGLRSQIHNRLFLAAKS